MKIYFEIDALAKAVIHVKNGIHRFSNILKRLESHFRGADKFHFFKTFALVSILSLFLLVTFAHAEEDWLSTCGSYSDLAETIMRTRQSGISMKQMLEVPLSKGFENLVIAAFEIPRFSTDAMQKRSIEDFRDSIYLECVKIKKPK